MKTKALIIFAAASLSVVSAAAPPPASKNFEEFRSGMHRRYNAFREEMLSNYAKFLDGEWVEFQWFPAEERDNTPKPAEAPAVDKPAVPTAPVAEPQPTVEPKPEPAPEPIPAPEPTEEPAPELKPVPRPEPGRPTEPEQPAGVPFEFYDMTLMAPSIDVRITDRMTSTNDYAAQWRSLASNPGSADLIKALSDIAAKLNLNDYLTFDLARRYALARFPKASAASRTSLVHYIMANLGYDARIGTTPDGQAVLMMPCKQTVYGHTYLLFGQEKYYVFTDPTVDLVGRRMAISTCQLPAIANEGRKLDLKLSPLALPEAPKEFKITDGNLTISGTVNANLFPVLYRYPQMPIADYARSQLMPDVRSSIVEQLKQQLKDKPKAQAVDELLTFVQKGFDYATDDQAHGFEKPYFFEETLFYPQCDCEDRVIFYTYLLWNVLGVENHLITFPGHESASVSFPEAPQTGDAYNYDGKRFLISDPTFIGARTGMCMPAYKTTPPEIDHIYK